jgi:hypothetical protein
MQNPLFSGEAGSFGYMPSQKVAIAVAATFDPAAFDPTTGAYKNSADFLWRKTAAAGAIGPRPTSFVETPPTARRSASGLRYRLSPNMGVIGAG